MKKLFSSQPATKDPHVAVAAAAAVQGFSPLPSKKDASGGPHPRRAGYNSEGYFSSDQEDQEFFVKKFKNLDKGGGVGGGAGGGGGGAIRPTNLAQEKKILASHPALQRSLLTANGANANGGGGLEEGLVMSPVGGRRRHNNSFSEPHNGQLDNPESWFGAAAIIPVEDPDETDDEDIDEEADLREHSQGEEMPTDAASDSGTYTIDQESAEVERARKDIERLVTGRPGRRPPSGPKDNGVEDFKVNHKNNTKQNRPIEMSEHHKESWVDEWARQVARLNHSAIPPLPANKHSSPPEVVNALRKGSPTAGLTRTQGIPTTRIPSPVLGSPTGSRRHQVSPQPRRRITSPTQQTDCETESFLRTTESVVSAMQARMTLSLSLDSGGESDGSPSTPVVTLPARTPLASRRTVTSPVAERRRPGVNVNSIPHSGGLTKSSSLASVATRIGVQSDSSSETGEPRSRKTNITDTRYNRAFSLRRARLEGDPEPPPTPNAPPPTPPCERKQTSRAPLVNSTPAIRKPAAIARTDCGRTSMRGGKSAVSKKTSVPPDPKRLNHSNNNSKGARSNSTLSSREVEFQNWKRRKSYDPLKAAKEGKKKEAQAKRTGGSSGGGNAATSSLMTTSLTQASLADSDTSPTHSTNPVLRSASFHGAPGVGSSRSGGGGSSEDDDDDDCEAPPSGDEEIRPARRPRPPPPGSPAKNSDAASASSKVSLYSNASNSSLRSRAKLEALDNLVISTVNGLSGKLKLSAVNLLKKLRFLYDEDLDRADRLTDVIEVLEAAPDSGASPPPLSPSKELSATLKNLKRIESVFQVLDEVLFDEEDFEEDILSEAY